MATSGTLHDAFVDELCDVYDAEKQLIKALPKLAKASTSPELRGAFETHLEETRGQVERLERVFGNIDERVRGKHCDGIEGIIEEGSSVMDEDFPAQTMDACLIASGQRAEHYEMAAYGTLVSWARSMGHIEAAELLQQNLDEEKAADEKLTSLAEGGINAAAAQGAHVEAKSEADPTGSRSFVDSDADSDDSDSDSNGRSQSHSGSRPKRSATNGSRKAKAVKSRSTTKRRKSHASMR